MNQVMEESAKRVEVDKMPEKAEPTELKTRKKYTRLMGGMQAYSIRITAPQKEFLENHCLKNGVSSGEQIRALISAWMAREKRLSKLEALAGFDGFED